MVALMPVPHPDVPSMPVGATSPSVDEASAAPAHFIVTALGLEGIARERDKRMAALTATVIENTPAVGAMLGHGVMFHKAKLFAEVAAAAIEDAGLPAELSVDVTAEREAEDRMSFLTHGRDARPHRRREDPHPARAESHGRRRPGDPARPADVTQLGFMFFFAQSANDVKPRGTSLFAAAMRFSWSGPK